MKFPGALVYVGRGVRAGRLTGGSIKVGILIRRQLTRNTMVMMPMTSDPDYMMTAWDVFVDGRLVFCEESEIQTEEEHKAQQEVMRALFENPEMLKKWSLK